MLLKACNPKIRFFLHGVRIDINKYFADIFDFKTKLLQNIASGHYTINLNQIERISKEFLCFLEDCLRFEPLERKTSEQLEFTRFITRDYSKFSFITVDNYQEELPSEYIGEDNTIVFPIFNEKKLEEHFDL